MRLWKVEKNMKALLASFLFGMVATTAAAQVPAPTTAPPPGIWASTGYGWVLQIDPGGTQKLYHTSGQRCVADVGNGPMDELGSLVVVRYDADGTGFTSFSTQNISRHHFTRLDALPQACVNATRTDDPVENFEFVWQNFAEHYAFFPQRNIDWYRTYQRVRPQVTRETTPDQLYAILTAMFDSLDDRHITLNRPGFDQYRSGLGPVINDVKRTYDTLPTAQKTGFVDYLITRMNPHKELIATRYLGGRGQSGANEQITWGKIGNLGYLRIDSEGSYADEDDYLAEAAVLKEVLDKAFKEFEGTRGVILDLRFNLGGNDGHGLAIAGRFTDRPYQAYRKYVRHKEGWTPTQPLTVVPVGATAYQGPVYILTSNVTVSAGENLTFAMMGRPNTRRYGQTTASVMSDQLTKPMPNGWSFSISNEVFEAIDGVVYETKGIPPDVFVPSGVLFTPATRDPLLDRLMRLGNGGAR
jgi:carboxyl-terminal processing protease